MRLGRPWVGLPNGDGVARDATLEGTRHPSCGDAP